MKKSKKISRKIRLLAFILTLCLTLGALPLYVFADGTETELPEQITETTNENLTAFQLGLGEKSVAELENMTLSAADIPASISRETVEAKDHVLRLREQEADLNTVIFQNRDGGKTVYLFGAPVKYVDASGNIRDKSATLVSENVTVNGKTYAHSATDNFFGQYYPTMPQNGVMLAFGPYTVEMKPVITGVLTLRDTVVADNKVTYNKVFGTGTSIVYTPTLNGVKEDIILQTYTGKSSFSFTIKTNGLAIIQDENDTFLADFEGNKVASLGDVIITDSANHTTYGTMTVVTKIEREEYTITVNAPTAFLANPTTVYPVTVDPTFVIEEEDYISEGGSDGAEWGAAIHDLCFYSGSNPGYPESSVGVLYYNEDSCETETARMLYRINPNYYEYHSIANYLSSSRFSAAMLYLPVNSYGNSIAVNIHPYTDEWGVLFDENDEKYYTNGTVADYTDIDVYNSYAASVVSSSTVETSSYTTVGFDITDIVEYWVNNNNYDQGLVLGCADDFSPEHEVTEPVYIDVIQSEDNASNIYFQIDYANYINYYYIHNNQNSNYNINDNGVIYDNEKEKNILSTDTSENISLQSISNNYHQCWKLEYIGENDYYIISGANLNQALYCSGSTVSLGANRAISDNRYKWKIVTNSGFVEFVNTYNGLRLAYSETDNTYIFASTASNQTKWNLYKAFNSEDSSSTDKIAYFLGVPDEDHDHSSVYGNIMPLVPNIYTDEFEIELNKDIDPSDILNIMQKSKIFVFRGHGDVSDNQDKGSSIILTGDSPLTGKIYPSYIYNFSSKEIKKDLSNCEIALFIACHTANGTESLPIAAVNAGAKYAVGFNTTIGCTAANTWAECFFTSYNSGATVYESVEDANQRSGLNAVLITND